MSQGVTEVETYSQKTSQVDIHRQEMLHVHTQHYKTLQVIHIVRRCYKT